MKPAPIDKDNKIFVRPKKIKEVKNYLTNNTSTQSYVFFKTLDRNGFVVKDYPNAPCFAQITNYGIDKSVASILIYHNKAQVPYSVESIERWMRDINEMGFPSNYIGSNDAHHNFQVNISDCEYKAHLLSTLMLTRALFEQGINLIPNQYFQEVDQNPDIDKFDLLQTIHKDKKYMNHGGHMIVSCGYSYGGNQNEYKNNVTQETLFKRYNGTLKTLDGEVGKYSPAMQQDKWKAA